MPTADPHPLENRSPPGEKARQDAEGQLPLGDDEARGAETFPVIAYNQRPLRDVVEDCLVAVKKANTPPRLFQQGNLLARVRFFDQEAFTEPLNEHSLRGALERSATFVSRYFKDGQLRSTIKLLPIEHVRDILALPQWPEDVFPILNSLARCPFFTADGTLVVEPGYHPGSRIWFAPAQGLAIETVPSSPTDREVGEARHWLMNELLGDFPFQTDADKANALAFLLTPFLREMIQGPVPMGLIEAPAAGTGKGLLANALTIPATGNFLETIPQRQSDDEWRKAITAKLLEMPTHILFDNLTGTLRSAALEAALTSELWADRMLGETRIVRMKIRTIWLATGNNLQVAGDLYRRTVWIRLDAKMEHPEDRTPIAFNHPRLLQWAKAHRGELIWAALTIVRAWIARGKPAGLEVMGSYESWASMLGGILTMIDVTGFLTNLQKSRLNADDELVQLGNFVEAWKKEYGHHEVTIGQLFDLVALNDHLLPFVMEPDKEHGRKVRLGRYVSRHRDRTVGTDQIVELPPDKRSRTKRYCLVSLTAEVDATTCPSPQLVQDAPTVFRGPARDFPGLLDDRPLPKPVVTPAVPMDSRESDNYEIGDGGEYAEDEESQGFDPEDLDA